jgi:hypothetical protein
MHCSYAVVSAVSWLAVASLIRCSGGVAAVGNVVHRSLGVGVRDRLPPPACCCLQLLVISAPSKVGIASGVRCRSLSALVSSVGCPIRREEGMYRCYVACCVPVFDWLLHSPRTHLMSSARWVDIPPEV